MSRQTVWLEVDLHSWWSVKGKLGKATQSQPVTQSSQRPEYLSNYTDNSIISDVCHSCELRQKLETEMMD